MILVYGIKNCDTVKKALKELEKRKIEFELIDFKKNAPTLEMINRWQKALGEMPVNKRGTTFRKIKESFESGNRDQQVQILIANPSAIKRPIFEKGKTVLGFGYSAEILNKIS